MNQCLYILRSELVLRLNVRLAVLNWMCHSMILVSSLNLQLRGCFRCGLFSDRFEMNLRDGQHSKRLSKKTQQQYDLQCDLKVGR